MDYKERWQRFFNAAQADNPDGTFEEWADEADDELADDEAQRIDAAYEQYRDNKLRDLDAFKRDI